MPRRSRRRSPRGRDSRASRDDHTGDQRTWGPRQSRAAPRLRAISALPYDRFDVRHVGELNQEGDSMAVVVRIPTPLRSLTKGNAEVQAKGGTVDDVVEDLERQFPGLRERLVDEKGELRRFINLYVNEEDVRFLQ